MTFNACMKKHFDEAFGPYGFKKLKSKYPYWGRMVGNEILQVLTYQNEWSMKPYKDFSIWGGVATVYRQKINLEETPKNQKKWMIDSREIFKHLNYSLVDVQSETEKLNNLYIFDDENSMIDKIRNAVEICSMYMIPELLKIYSLDDCVDFYREYNPGLLNILGYRTGENILDVNEGLILFDIQTLDEYTKYSQDSFDRDNDRWLGIFKKNLGEDYRDEYIKDFENRKNWMEESLKTFEYMVSNKEVVEKYNEIKKERRENNIAYLKSKGI